MARLIDADALIEELHHIIEDDAELRQDYMYIGVDDCIRSMPTAYSVEKVVEELEEEKDNCNKVNVNMCAKYTDCFKCLTDRAISVVKAGGVE